MLSSPPGCCHQKLPKLFDFHRVIQKIIQDVFKTWYIRFDTFRLFQMQKMIATSRNATILQQYCTLPAVHANAIKTWWQGMRRASWRCCCSRQWFEHAASTATVACALADRTPQPFSCVQLQTATCGGLQWYTMHQTQFSSIFLLFIWSVTFSVSVSKKVLRETQMLHAGCSKAEPKIFALP